ncbi:hypothetical protein KY290_032351 [Solanum tuberosum]|uniref:Uncharacterized protein n=1 Tax=Solanum tuberosum TaxID=4113 RepID=A0ABQ7UBW3_SOLTU|nr:hypothetical protein KY290_032351 [Solanum tuberosum]
MNWKIFQVSWICSISSVLWAKSVLSAWTQKERAANEWGNTNISTEQFWSFRNQDILVGWFVLLANLSLLWCQLAEKLKLIESLKFDLNC